MFLMINSYLPKTFEDSSNRLLKFFDLDIILKDYFGSFVYYEQYSVSSHTHPFVRFFRPFPRLSYDPRVFSRTLICDGKARILIIHNLGICLNVYTAFNKLPKVLIQKLTGQWISCSANFKFTALLTTQDILNATRCVMKLYWLYIALRPNNTNTKCQVGIFRNENACYIFNLTFSNKNN